MFSPMSAHRCKAVPLCFDYWLLLAELFSQESIKSCIRKFEFEVLSKEHLLPSDLEFYDLTLENAAVQDPSGANYPKTVEPTGTVDNNKSGK